MAERSADDVDASIVIVSWNVRELLLACIRSIISMQDDLLVQIVVVDNASRDQTVEAVRREFPDVELIASDTNLGFSRGSNLGLDHAKGRYVFFLNPDTVLGEHALRRLVDFLEANRDFDVVGPRLVSPDGTPQWVGARHPPSPALLSLQALYLHRLPLIGRRLLNRMVVQYDLNVSQEVEAVSGAAMVSRRAALERVKGFDESFPYTSEDIDLCLRLRRHGSRIFYLAEATITHIGEQSSSQAWARTGTMSMLSTEMYLARAHGRFHALVYRMLVQFVQVPIMVVVGFAKALLGRNASGSLRERLVFAKSVWRRRVEE
jgi:GT2 family glycosyltransferase